MSCHSASSSSDVGTLTRDIEEMSDPGSSSSSVTVLEEGSEGWGASRSSSLALSELVGCALGITIEDAASECSLA